MLKIPQIIVIIIIVLLVFYGLQRYQDSKNSSKVSNLPNSVSNEIKPESPLTSIVATTLEVPWALAFLPDGNILVTERVGGVRLIKDGKLQEESVADIAVRQTGESGLHGIAIHPDFEKNHYVYIYYTYSTGGDNSLNGLSMNKVSRFTYNNEKLTDEKVIVDKIPGAVNHDGGRIKFGPDGQLYITTGDAQNPSLSQDKNSLAGKILRIKDEGTPQVISYGHRNPQGIAWDDMGRLWETEHGQSATDELNLIEMGKNYGWPVIRGTQSQQGMENPKIQSGSDTWAPAGMAFIKGSLYFAGLRGQALFQVDIKTLEKKEHFKGEFGRIRDVVLGSDNMLYITTSNRDGRGSPRSSDDKIIRVNPKQL